jgi:phage regulator Rha-like protein
MSAKNSDKARRDRLQASGPGSALTTTPAASSLVHVSYGKPVTDSLAIAREFGRQHKHGLRTLDSLIADGTINRPNFGPISYTDELNRPQRLIELDERAALIAMPFIGGRNSRIGQVRLVDAFLATRAAMEERKSVGWTQARQQAASNYAVVSEMLMLRREAEGKVTQAHHYANEARLLNFVFSGDCGPIERDGLTAAELHLLHRLEIRDSALIAMGKSYAERKAALMAYKAELTTPKLEVSK